METMIVDPIQEKVRALEQYKVPPLNAIQLRLSKLWDFYTGNQYSDRRYDWDGRPIMHELDKLQLGMLAVPPEGFVPQPVESVPWMLRRPIVTSGIAGLIVDRFTSLLFSEHNAPVLRPYPEEGQEWIDAVIEQSDWLDSWRRARTYGGATGVAIVGFHFEEGMLRLDIFDPRFTFVEFEGPEEDKITRLEIVYEYETTERHIEYRQGGEVTVSRVVNYYYRRVITPELDVVFEPLPEREAETVGLWTPRSVVAHNLGFVPAVWIENLPAEHSRYGKADFAGTEDKILALDAQLSQAHVGTLYNSDPTLIIKTDKEVGSLRKGSRHAIVLEPGGDAHYLELSAGGPKASLDLADRLQDMILHQASVVLNPGSNNMTAEEVRRRYEAMYDKADILRAQYGEAMERLLKMIIEAQQTLAQQGKAVDLPEPPESVEIEWPAYMKETSQDRESEIRQVVMAVGAGLLPKEIAVKKLAKVFGIEDIEEVMQELEQQRPEEMQEA